MCTLVGIVYLEYTRSIGTTQDERRFTLPPNKALQQTGLSVATLPLAPAAERRYVGQSRYAAGVASIWAVARMAVGAGNVGDCRGDVRAVAGRVA